MGERASASWRRATSWEKGSSPTPLIMSVARVMGYAVAYFIQQVAHRFCQQRDRVDDEPAEDKKNNERYVIGGGAGKLARFVAGKQWRLPHKRQ